LPLRAEPSQAASWRAARLEAGAGPEVGPTALAIGRPVGPVASCGRATIMRQRGGPLAI